MKRRLFFWSGISLILLVVFAWAFCLYTKPHHSAGAEAADFTIIADSLYRQYATDENGSNAKYLNKIIVVRGRLTKIQSGVNSEIWIISQQPGGGGINCQLFAGQKPNFGKKIGDTVVVKGRCSGFLADVNLADCVEWK